MAAASDKARFLQERSVPELQEFARKKIFTKDEIASIARKRSDFEHILNARGSKPQNYAQYLEYETNLETLRQKRVKRLGVKTSNHTGKRRISSLLDRATKKFPGDVSLWMQYIAFAQKQGSNKKVSQLLTSVLRLHPTKPDLWIYAATVGGAHITEARSYMQRGLRLCGSSEGIWIEYARLEMVYVSKIAGRRRVLGLDVAKIEENGRHNSEEEDDDMITFPDITPQEIVPAQRPNVGTEQEALEKLSTGSVLSGAIPVAIFDTAMKRFKESNGLCLQFFDMAAEFRALPCQQSILSHIMAALRSIAPKSPGTLIRWIQQPVIGIDATTPEFPARFGLCLDHLKRSFETLTPTDTTLDTARPINILGEQVIAWLLSYEKEDIDADVRKVISRTIRKVESTSGRL